MGLILVTIDVYIIEMVVFAIVYIGKCYIFILSYILLINY